MEPNTPRRCLRKALDKEDLDKEVRKALDIYVKYEKAYMKKARWYKEYPLPAE